MVLPAGPSAAIVVERLFLRGWQVEAGQRGMAVGTDAMAAAEQMVGLTRCIALHAKNSPAEQPRAIVVDPCETPAC